LPDQLGEKGVIMKTLFAVITALLCLCSSSAWAVDCYKDARGGGSVVTTTLPAFTIPTNATIGQKVWESGDLLVTVYCDNATRDHTKPVEQDPWSEDIFAYILDSFHNTDSLVTNNPYLAFGVTYNGVDYDTPDIKIDTGACLDKRPDSNNRYDYAECNGITPQKSTTFSVRFRLYVKLRSIPTQPSEYTLPAVTVLTFDGSGGINMLTNAKNLHYNIDGLSNIHFLDCTVDVHIYPENQIVNFGQFSDKFISTQPLQAPFSVSTMKDATAGCTEQFDVATSFYTTDTLYDDTHLEMGNGLLMSIADKTAGGSDVAYNQYLPFATYVPGEGSATVTHDYIAELTKKPGASLTLGPFSRDLIVKVNYQ
jgi:hypothetical protein